MGGTVGRATGTFGTVATGGTALGGSDGTTGTFGSVFGTTGTLGTGGVSTGGTTRIG